MIYIIESQLNPLRRQILALVRPDLLERELQNEQEVITRMTICRRCADKNKPDTILTGFITNTENRRCENCGNVAAELAVCVYNQEGK